MSAQSGKTALIVSLTQSSAQAMRAAMTAARDAGADIVECRLDYLASRDEAALRALLTEPPLPVIATCRPVRQGGCFSGSETDRLSVMVAARELGATWVDVEDDVPLEAMRAIVPAASDSPRRKAGVSDPCETVQGVNPLLPQGANSPPRKGGVGARLILSHHDFASRPDGLDGLLAKLAGSPAEVVKIAFAAAGPEDAIAALDLLRKSAKPAIALAMGEHGVASRILARKFSAFGTFASLSAGEESAPGQLTPAEMRRLFRWDAIGPETKVYGVIGCPIAHSMSPAIHNAAFAAAGIDAVYVPLRIEPGEGPFRRFMGAAAGAPWLDLGGLSVTIPHKENALAAVGPERVDELSRRIGAINTIRVEPDGSLRGWNTDYAGATDALCGAMGIAREGLAGRAVAIVGAGGAARAIVAAMAHYGAQVTIHNRTVSRAEKLAEEFGAMARGLDELAGAPAEILINCTSVGMHPNVDATPVAAEVLSGVKVVFDTVYNPVQTRLLREASAAGCTCVSGVDMFVNQAASQFEIWTGRAAPRELMRGVVLEKLRERKQ